MATSTYAAETPRLYLERLSLEKHLDDFHELWNNDEAVLWSSKPKKNTVEESREWMVEFILPTAETQDIDKFALLLKGSENGEGKKLKMIGFVGTNRWCEQGMEVGYCLNIAYWGKGFATEGFTAFLKLFWMLPERKGISRLVAKTHPDNKASQRVCGKCGGVKGEVLSGAYERFVDGGRMSDVWLFCFDRPGGGVVGGEGERGREKLEE